MMNRKFFGLAIVSASVITTIGVTSPARSQPARNYVGPALSIGGGQTAIGADSRFNLSERLSLRPHLFFPNNGTRVGAAITYDFDASTDYTQRVKISPYAGAGVDFSGLSNNSNVTNAYVVAGADFGFNENISVKGEVNIPVNSANSQSTSVTLGAGFYF
jgi:opacity protein-like surface antigen